MSHKLTSPLPPTRYCLLQLVASHTLLITLNRPDMRNALHLPAHHELATVFDYVESEPEIWCSVITGAGEKSFCAGADLKSLLTNNDNSSKSVGAIDIHAYPSSGFGYAFGGGMEIILACDVVVATERATFAMPEVKRGVVAANGGIAQLVRVVGYQRAMSILLTGRVLSAREAKEYGFVNEVVQSKKEALKTALAYARLITTASPDAVGVTKLAANWALNDSTGEATKHLIQSDELRITSSGQNAIEGVKAFAERRPPRWQNSKL
ncbi:ClpP/crotonase-like domain-containing protein [Syncephalis fuscata]|nr:ClpP/crotonase-like domain-containing protein [Syncephalis fuscata]